MGRGRRGSGEERLRVEVKGRGSNRGSAVLHINDGCVLWSWSGEPRWGEGKAGLALRREKVIRGRGPVAIIELNK